MIDPRRLLLLRTLSQHGTVAATAAFLGCTPSAVSQQLSVLERELGLPLLDRDRRSVRLTDLATQLVARADLIADQLDSADALVAIGRHEIVGTMRVAAYPTFAAHLAIAARSVAKQYPNLEMETFDLEPDQAILAVARGDVDLAVMHDYNHDPRPIDPALDTQPLFEEPLVMFAHEHRPSAPLATYARETFAAPVEINACGRAVRAACRQAGFEPRIAHHSNDFSVLLAHVATGNAVALLPRSATQASTPIASELTDQLWRRTYTAIRSARKAHPTLIAARTHLAAAVSGHLPS